MKTQIKFQKAMCLTMLIVGALSVVYSLIYLTGSVSYMGIHYDYTQDPIEPLFTGAELFVDIQPFNTAMFYLSIGIILSAVLLFITATNKRRKYYVTNYVATGITVGYNVITSIILMAYNASFRSAFLNNTDFAEWKTVDIETRINFGLKSAYSESTAMFDLGFAVYAIVIVASLLLVANLVWKLFCEKAERQLLTGSEIKEGAAL